MDSGNVADWVSAICNGVIAYTAIAALTKAKDYLQNKLTEEDISLWLQINDNVSSIASSVTVLWLLYERMINQWTDTKDHQILKHHYLSYLSYVNNFTEQLHKLDEYEHRLSLRSSTFKKHAELKSLIKELNSFNRLLTSKVDSIITLLKWSGNVDEEYQKAKENFTEFATKSLSNPLVLNEELQNTYNILREFGIDDHHSKLNITTNY